MQHVYFHRSNFIFFLFLTIIYKCSDQFSFNHRTKVKNVTPPVFEKDEYEDSSITS